MKAKDFIEAVQILEGLPNFKVGNRIKLANDVMSNKKQIMPKNSIVEVTKVKKTGKIVAVDIESIDGEVATMIFKATDKFPHKIVR